MQIHFLYPEGRVKALTMSYDDGSNHDRRLVDIFNRHNIKGTFHLNSGLFNDGYHLNTSEVKALYTGHEISCHSVNHPFLERLPTTLALNEIIADRQALEEIAGYPVIGMSYPYGTYSDEVINIARAAGIVYSRTVEATGYFGVPNDFLRWASTCHHNDMLTIAPKFLELRPNWKMALMYVWGHSHEFDNNDNWADIEEFCAMMGNHSEIWYATNIEIYHYLSSVRRAVCSVNNTMIYNPTDCRLWGEKDGEIFQIAPGETIRF